MNAKLHNRIEKTVEKTESFYRRDGNFTICLLLGNAGDIVSIGVAKRNPNCDLDVPERGKEIALARAVKNIGRNRPEKDSHKKNGKK